MSIAKDPEYRNHAPMNYGEAVDGVRPRKTWPQFVASFMLNDFVAIKKQAGIDSPFDALPTAVFTDILALLYEGLIDRKTARQAVQWNIERHQEVRDFVRFVADFLRAETPNA